MCWCLIYNMLHLEDIFIFLFLNSCIAPRGEIITSLSILHMVLFLFGVLRYESLRDAAVGGVALANPRHAFGQRSRAVSQLSSWGAQCSPSTSSRSRSVQRRWILTACRCWSNPKPIKSPEDRLFPFLLLLPPPPLLFNTRFLHKSSRM